MDLPLNPELVSIRKRFLEDFEFWAKHACKIRTKKGTITSLVLNRVQRRFLKVIQNQLLTTGRVRLVVLKARQQGLSTVISAFQYWWLSQHSAQKGLVMAHEADSTTTLFDMYKRIHDNAPEMLKPSTKYSSRTELVFDKLDTALRIATAGGRGVARGETLTSAHLSEVAFWPVTFAKANFNGLIKAVPNEDNTFVFLESTANGVTGQFHEMWVGAVSGANGYEAFFSPWFESDEYRDDSVPADFAPTPSERTEAAKYDLDYAQLFWRRKEINLGSHDLFKQEYPSNANEAFLTTGRPVFDPAHLPEAREPVMRMAVENGSVKEHSAGELLVWHELDPKETYAIGADVGMGLRNGDPSVAQVLDSKLRQVAVWRGLVQPDYFATVLNTLGFYYNTALVAPERNNHGILTCVRLGRDLMYPNTYTDVTEGALDDKESIQIGFFTSERTKPLIIDKLRAVLRKEEMELYDKTTLEEMLTFVVTESGRMEAVQGCHDDCVLSLAIANHIHEGRWDPCVVSDEHYVEAI